MTELYISFGSNLNKRQMRLRCATARPLGKFILTNARLVFRGVADVEYEPGGHVPCGLWAINRADERALDAYEGVSLGLYFKSRDIVLKYCGRRRPALIYLMNSEGVYPPTQHYVDIIRRGYKDFDLDEAYLDAAIERSFEEKSPDEQILARRARQRQNRNTAQLVEMPMSVAMRRMEARGQLES